MESTSARASEQARFRPHAAKLLTNVTTPVEVVPGQRADAARRKFVPVPATGHAIDRATSNRQTDGQQIDRRSIQERTTALRSLNVEKYDHK
ncbi:hypothetical protein [Mesorhizobium sp. M5C.F.Ca.IN.020.32.2.1]|uniref:hypothetical protein n=1 Tax=Mesorhizobium sp. M5C.F.Ca.IN.020.32.2.1 TaxID=2496771 RepID=UPI000FD53391|nr:hypothetical protein [Mesorhizobium sp. M5C.F.Ca.IN.020.32.2.1]RUV32795.1 hypothetical protein EOA86_00990 [Mesorhizobium sp. M5C.F.Ca.IN.020.32.2.1]